jgi:hypothetical protein
LWPSTDSGVGTLGEGFTVGATCALSEGTKQNVSNALASSAHFIFIGMARAYSSQFGK